MGTWAELLNSIQIELNRDDLETVIPEFTRGRINYAQRDFYYPTPVTRFMACVPGQNFYPVPADMIAIQIMQLNNANVWQLVQMIDYFRILMADTNIPPTRSVPTVWAPYDSGFRLYQTPDLPYPLELTGLGRIPVPPNDDDSNFWTEDAADYIRCATLAHLFLRRIKNFDQYKAYAMAAEEFRIALMRETIAKTTHSQLQAWW